MGEERVGEKEEWRKLEQLRERLNEEAGVM